MSFLRSLAKAFSPQPRKRRSKTGRCQRGLHRMRLESLEDRNMFSAVPFDAPPVEPSATYCDTAYDVASDIAVAEFVSESLANAQSQPQPVLIVISNQDFWYQDYADTRSALEAAGLDVVVAATSTDAALPQANSGQGADGGVVQPDIALTDVEAEDYSAIVFSGGWGMAQYQYGFEGTYDNMAYRGDEATKTLVNGLIQDFVAQDKIVGAICYGVSVLAYARVDGSSLLEGRDVTGWQGIAPSAGVGWQASRDQIESNGAQMAAGGSIGDPATSADDVIVDGNIITAENYDAAARFGEVIAARVLADAADQPSGDSDSDSDSPIDSASDEVQPVLMVIANRDFYHREYYETRASLEASGLDVVVAAATTEVATPHAISVVEGREPNVQPDLALADAQAEDYSAIVFVGGYGAASYQYANETTYDNPAYQGSDEVKQVVNDLINDFVAQDKYVTAICNGVTVLAWARVDGVSPLQGVQVASWAHELPSADGGVPQFTRSHIEANGGIQFASQSIGNPTTAADDVFIDGKIITAENFDTAYAFGAIIAQQLLEDAE